MTTSNNNGHARCWRRDGCGWVVVAGSGGRAVAPKKVVPIKHRSETVREPPTKNSTENGSETRRRRNTHTHPHKHPIRMTSKCALHARSCLASHLPQFGRKRRKRKRAVTHKRTHHVSLPGALRITLATIAAFAYTSLSIYLCVLGSVLFLCAAWPPSSLPTRMFRAIFFP